MIKEFNIPRGCKETVRGNVFITKNNEKRFKIDFYCNYSLKLSFANSLVSLLSLNFYCKFILVRIIHPNPE